MSAPRVCGRSCAACAARARAVRRRTPSPACRCAALPVRSRSENRSGRCGESARLLFDQVHVDLDAARVLVFPERCVGDAARQQRPLFVEPKRELAATREDGQRGRQPQTVRAPARAREDRLTEAREAQLDCAIACARALDHVLQQGAVVTRELFEADADAVRVVAAPGPRHAARQRGGASVELELARDRRPDRHLTLRCDAHASCAEIDRLAEYAARLDRAAEREQLDCTAVVNPLRPSGFGLLHRTPARVSPREVSRLSAGSRKFGVTGSRVQVRSARSSKHAKLGPRKFTETLCFVPSRHAEIACAPPKIASVGTPRACAPTTRDGHYESFFQRANHPSRPLAFWIRYTALIPRGAPDAVSASSGRSCSMASAAASSR